MTGDATRIRVEKRNRQPVSCEPCRARKLKCDRALPCESCIKRNKSAICQYIQKPAPGKPARAQQPNLKDRLDNLETLLSEVLQRSTSEHGSSSAGTLDGAGLLTSNLTPAASSETSTSLRPSTPESLLGQEKSVARPGYIDPNHWRAILEEINTVRGHLEANNGNPTLLSSADPPRVRSDASFLFDHRTDAETDTMLQALPTRSQCDSLISFYFNSPTGILPIVHPDKFRREYQAFWMNPTVAKPLWLALLFAILGVATNIQQLLLSEEFKDQVPAPLAFLTCVERCLVRGNYATANEYALEAFLLHLQCSFIRRNSAALSSWFQLGTMIQLAIRMGYHRDPAKLNGLSVIEGEMRRRVWINLVQLEALISHQTGYPSMVPMKFCDTLPPRNLHFSDLPEDIDNLPVDRPLHERTPVTYSLIKQPVMMVFREIVEHSQALDSPSLDAVFALDAKCRQTYMAIPEHYQRKEISQCFMDATGIIFERCTLENLYLKSLIILHRRYVHAPDLRTAVAQASRTACIEAALAILSCQADIGVACSEGGRLYPDRAVFKAIPAHDCLLAAMVLCLDVSIGMRNPAVSADALLFERETEALRLSRNIWAADAPSFPDARTATATIDVMLEKLATYGGAPVSAMQETPFEFDWEQSLPFAESMSHMIDGSDAVDWHLLDLYFLDPNAPLQSDLLESSVA